MVAEAEVEYLRDQHRVGIELVLDARLGKCNYSLLERLEILEHVGPEGLVVKVRMPSGVDQVWIIRVERASHDITEDYKVSVCIIFSPMCLGEVGSSDAMSSQEASEGSKDRGAN